jgi:hypothetical protein
VFSDSCAGLQAGFVRKIQKDVKKSFAPLRHACVAKASAA